MHITQSLIKLILNDGKKKKEKISYQELMVVKCGSVQLQVMSYPDVLGFENFHTKINIFAEFIIQNHCTVENILYQKDMRWKPVVKGMNL